LTPQGIPLTACLAKDLSREKHLVLLCGHYEGIDQRAIDSDVDVQISIGDYVLTNGCLAALVLIDALARFIPGVLGDELASAQDSFEGGILDCPHYTHPKLFEGRAIPEILLSGDHERIREWRRTMALQSTLSVRPDLLTDLPQSVEAPSPVVQQIIMSTPLLQKVVRWYSEMLGILPQLFERKATFVCGTTQLTFIEGPLTAPSWEVLSFMLDTERFYSSQNYAGRKKVLFRVTEKDGWLRAFSQDPDGRRVEFVTFTKN
jgi:hypothetical protein